MVGAIQRSIHVHVAKKDTIGNKTNFQVFKDVHTARKGDRETTK